MSQNILSLNPFQPHPIQQLTSKIVETLDKFYAQNPAIEIQFKYAEFTAFCDSYYEQAQIPNDVKKKVNEVCSYFVLEQNQFHFDTLKKLSHFNLILLNQFGSRVYKIQGGFNEKAHKKFYKMREFLINLCRQNQENIKNGLNFYFDVQEIPMNKTFRIINESELRFDVNIKHGEYTGRYSYIVGKGWTKTNKENLSTQYDLMMAQKTFRMAIKKEVQVQVTPEEVYQAISSQKGGVFLRFKRALRVSKNNQVQIALSEIYQPDQQRRAQCTQDLTDILQLAPESLDGFCTNVFQQFYMWQSNPNMNISFMDSISKFEIQSQFLPEGLKKIFDLHKRRQYKALNIFIQTTLNDLYALSFVDHNVKKRQTSVMSQIIKRRGHYEEKFPECRLENEFGTYMHDCIYEYMTST